MRNSEAAGDESDKGNIDRLREYLVQLQPGKLAEPGEAISLLQACWGQFDGSSDESTTADKLDRAEDVAWDPPCFVFTLERHGGTVKGSLRAALHRWKANVETMTAGCDSSGHRPMVPQDKALDVKPLASEIAELILRHTEGDERVHWYPDGHCRVEIQKVIPDGRAKQTTAGRRKRFRTALKDALGDNWTESRANSYRPINCDM